MRKFLEKLEKTRNMNDNLMDKSGQIWTNMDNSKVLLSDRESATIVH